MLQEEVVPQCRNLEEACLDSVLSAKRLFALQPEGPTPEFYEALKLKINIKVNDEYKYVKDLQEEKTENIAAQIHQQTQNFTQVSNQQTPMKQALEQKKVVVKEEKQNQLEKIINELPQGKIEKISKLPRQFLQFQNQASSVTESTYLPPDNVGREVVSVNQNQKQIQVLDPVRLGSVLANKVKKIIRPDWHRPWKLMRVISGHHGWVRCVSVDPANQFFVTGSGDRTIKFWDLATGSLKTTYTGHISTVRGVVVSHRHPYLFSCGEDKTVKCWDLEQNKIIRDYHGHLSGVYCITQHPTLDFIATGGRDSVVRLWDIRTRQQIHVFEGHTGTIDTVISQEYEPQLVSGSQDSMVRTWDIASGKCFAALTNHKKSVRAMTFNPNEYTFCSAAPDNIKVWKCPEGTFLRNISGHNAIINTVSVNKDNVLISGADNGSLYFWDWKSGYNFQKIQTIPQPGSITAENGIYCSTFDQSQMRFITGECDKTIKIYKEDEDATPETHPIDDFKIEFQTQSY